MSQKFWKFTPGVITASVVLGLLPLAILDSQDAAKKRRVLLVTGHDVPAHDWRATTPLTRSILESSGGFEVFVSEEPSVLETTALLRYDLVVLNYRNPPTESLSEGARANLLRFVKSGKGLVAVHFSISAWGDWAEYQKLVGRIWVGKKEAGEKASGHGPRGTFKVEVTAKDHAVTRGIEDFEADDELYARLAGDTPIHVLAQAHSADFSKQNEPMAWTLPYGDGRVFATVLGHDVKAREHASFKKLLIQGSEWAAGMRK